MQHSIRPVVPSCFQRLDEDADSTPASQTNFPRRIVVDAEFECLRRAGCYHIGRFSDDLSLDAASRHRTQEIALCIDHELAAHRLRRGTPGLDDCGERDPAPFG
jgi:hypothetical protein